MSKTRIIEAVKNLDLETTAKLLDTNPSLLAIKNRQGRNLLHLACSASCTKLKVPELIAARLVTFLLDRGMDIEEAGLSGRDPMAPRPTLRITTTYHPSRRPRGNETRDFSLLSCEVIV